MKTRFISVGIISFLGLIFIGLVLYTWKVSSEARVVVEWSTASELNTVGFNLYRSENSSDPGELVNAALIPASEDAQTGGDYKYTDKAIIPGRVYYYYLEDVSADGATNRHGPVIVRAQSNSNIVLSLIISLVVVVLFCFVILIWLRLKNRLRGNE